MRPAFSVYNFTFNTIDGEALPLSRFAGRALLLVNTASFCGFTPQYADLQTLWRRYGEKGLVVIGVPCNDFGGQEPGGGESIKEFCTTRFALDLPLTAKEHVIGAEAHPLYRRLAEELGEDAAPRWNFHKYLFDPTGQIVAIFPSQVSPLAPELIAAIESALAGDAHKP